MEAFLDILSVFVYLGIFIGLACLVFKALCAIGDVQDACRAIIRWVDRQIDEE